ncbi:MAG: NTPase [Candidatus Bathyarchaeota archaeon]|nr:NTPase [Candidatus Bathyarchaeota archaeon]
MTILDFWLLQRPYALPKRVILLTGNPGVGKTTVLTKAVNILKGSGICVGGMISREIRENGARVGFEILDLTSSRRGWLAHINQQGGPQVGKYRVNLSDLDSVGAAAIAEASEKCDAVAIDEIGPMELFSEKFKKAVQKALESQKPVIATIHWKATDKLISVAKSREDAEILTVTQENRDKLPEVIAQKMLKLLK